jgi:predicted enzyme related to lactoylglutathione lyase
VSVNQDPPVGRLDSVTIDCGDPERLAAFWSAVFAAREEWRGGDPVQYIDLAATAASPTIRFQQVPEPKTVKNRMHLDLRVDDIDEAASHVVALGATPVEQDDFYEYDVVFRVMLDPEGNEFCLVAGDG